jgi:hypothetical protein
MPHMHDYWLTSAAPKLPRIHGLGNIAPTVREYLF